MTASPIQLVFFLLPVIAAGCCNMIYVKLPSVRRRNAPMDGYRTANDGKRILGDHKTWQGFMGMILFTGLWMVVLVWICTHSDWGRNMAIVDYSQWRFPMEAILYGCLWGLGYVLFELPNSYIKRRIDIAPGKNASGWKGRIFLFVDQADSVLGCMVFMLLFYRPSVQEAMLLFAMGVGIHYVINIFLFLLGLKDQAG